MEEIINGFGYLGFVLSICSLIGIGYHKTRIRELTFAVGQLIFEVEELKKKTD